MSRQSDKERGIVGEQDWPASHPASADYKGKGYTPPEPLFSTDWDAGHPARLGGNVSKDWRAQQRYASAETQED